MFATIIIQPIDFIKVQIQVRSEMGQKNLNPFSITKQIRQETGTYKTFYRGLDSALLRQAVYTSTRLGLFYSIKDMIIKKTGKEPTMFSNVLMSLFAGAIGAVVGKGRRKLSGKSGRGRGDSGLMEKRCVGGRMICAVVVIVRDKKCVVEWCRHFGHWRVEDV